MTETPPIRKWLVREMRMGKPVYSIHYDWPPRINPEDKARFTIRELKPDELGIPLDRLAEYEEYKHASP